MPRAPPPQPAVMSSEQSSSTSSSGNSTKKKSSRKGSKRPTKKPPDKEKEDDADDEEDADLTAAADDDDEDDTERHEKSLLALKEFKRPSLKEQQQNSQRTLGQRVGVNYLWHRALDLTDKKTSVDHRLHDACKAGNMSRVKYLVEQKTSIDVNALFRQLTPLQYAIQQQHQAIIEYLVVEKEADVAKGMNGGAFISACLVGNLEIVTFLTEQRPDICHTSLGILQTTPLQIAADKGHLEIVTHLFKKCNVPLDPANTNGYTALHMAAAQGHDDVLQYLLHKGANGHAVSKKTGETPLHRATALGRVAAATAILDHYPVTCHVRNKKGQTPRDVARHQVATSKHPAPYKQLVKLLASQEIITPNPEEEKKREREEALAAVSLTATAAATTRATRSKSLVVPKGSRSNSLTRSTRPAPLVRTKSLGEQSAASSDGSTTSKKQRKNLWESLSSSAKDDSEPEELVKPKRSRSRSSERRSKSFSDGASSSGSDSEGKRKKSSKRRSKSLSEGESSASESEMGTVSSRRRSKSLSSEGESSASESEERLPTPRRSVSFSDGEISASESERGANKRKIKRLLSEGSASGSEKGRTIQRSVSFSDGETSACESEKGSAKPKPKMRSKSLSSGASISGGSSRSQDSATKPKPKRSKSLAGASSLACDSSQSQEDSTKPKPRRSKSLAGGSVASDDSGFQEGSTKEKPKRSKSLADSGSKEGSIKAKPKRRKNLSGESSESDDSILQERETSRSLSTKELSVDKDASDKELTPTSQQSFTSPRSVSPPTRRNKSPRAKKMPTPRSKTLVEEGIKSDDSIDDIFEQDMSSNRSSSKPRKKAAPRDGTESSLKGTAKQSPARGRHVAQQQEPVNEGINKEGSSHSKSNQKKKSALKDPPIPQQSPKETVEQSPSPAEKGRHSRQGSNISQVSANSNSTPIKSALKPADPFPIAVALPTGTEEELSVGLSEGVNDTDCPSPRNLESKGSSHEMPIKWVVKHMQPSAVEATVPTTANENDLDVERLTLDGSFAQVSSQSITKSPKPALRDETSSPPSVAEPSSPSQTKSDPPKLDHDRPARGITKPRKKSPLKKRASAAEDGLTQGKAKPRKKSPLKKRAPAATASTPPAQVQDRPTQSNAKPRKKSPVKKRAPVAVASIPQTQTQDGPTQIKDKTLATSDISQRAPSAVARTPPILNLTQGSPNSNSRQTNSAVEQNAPSPVAAAFPPTLSEDERDLASPNRVPAKRSIKSLIAQFERNSPSSSLAAVSPTKMKPELVDPIQEAEKSNAKPVKAGPVTNNAKPLKSTVKQRDLSAAIPPTEEELDLTNPVEGSAKSSSEPLGPQHNTSSPTSAIKQSAPSPIHVEELDLAISTEGSLGLKDTAELPNGTLKERDLSPIPAAVPPLDEQSDLASPTHETEDITTKPPTSEVDDPPLLPPAVLSLPLPGEESFDLSRETAAIEVFMDASSSSLTSQGSLDDNNPFISMLKRADPLPDATVETSRLSGANDTASPPVTEGAPPPSLAPEDESLHLADLVEAHKKPKQSISRNDSSVEDKASSQKKPLKSALKQTSPPPPPPPAAQVANKEDDLNLADYVKRIEAEAETVPTRNIELVQNEESPQNQLLRTEDQHTALSPVAVAIQPMTPGVDNWELFERIDEIETQMELSNAQHTTLDIRLERIEAQLAELRQQQENKEDQMLATDDMEERVQALEGKNELLSKRLQLAEMKLEEQRKAEERKKEESRKAAELKAAELKAAELKAAERKVKERKQKGQKKGRRKLYWV